MASKLFLSIVSPERKVLDKTEVKVIGLTGVEGRIEILPGHADMVALIQTGPFYYTDLSGASCYGVTSYGYVKIHGENVEVIAETFEFTGEIDTGRAERALQKARTELAKTDLSQDHFKKYQLKLQRALVRQQEASRNQ